MKILYGVPGEGMGHATRATVIISHLLKKHDVRIVSSDRAFTFLNNRFPGQVHEIKGYHLAFKDGAVSMSGTMALTLKNIPQNLMSGIKKFRELHASFEPDLVVSDFESFSWWFARLHKLPIISIDNMQIIDRGKLDFEIPDLQKKNFRVAKAIVNAKLPGCRYYLVSTFFKASLKKKNTILVPPIIREEILKARPARGNHILVYQSSYGKNGILNILKQLPGEKFLLYGFNKEEEHGNVEMKKFSEDEFIRNFASAKAVIANGGYSFISEAVYLKKPICSVPIQNQFEQYVNGAYVQKEGYGKLLNAFDPDGIKSFLYDLPVYQANIDRYKQDGNSELYSTTDRVLEEFAK